MFDWTINLSSLITIVANTIAVAGAFFLFLISVKTDINLIKSDVRYIQERLHDVAETLKQLSEILTKVAIQDTRLNMMEKYIDEMRHGRGFIRVED